MNKPIHQMTTVELQKRLYELNGIKPPQKNAPKKEWDKYFQACFLTVGMKKYGNKEKAQEFMQEQFGKRYTST